MESATKIRELYDGQVVEIVLGPPPGNIVATQLTEEISSELKRLQDGSPDNKNRKLIVFTGAGKHFSYGASVEEHKPDAVGAMLPRFHSLIQEILECPIPTMAKVSGLCLGGGFELVLACSLIYCDSDAKFGVPEIQLGVFPPAASALLPCKTGDSVVCQMILTGETMSASELHRLGIVNHVAEAGQLNGVVTEFIRKQIQPKSASSLRIACQAARAGVLEYFVKHIGEMETLYIRHLMVTADAKEGIDAFLAKRAPKWVNA